MPDPEAKRYGLRDLGIIISILGLLGNVLYTAASNNASVRSTSDWHEARITKLEAWQADVTKQLHGMDKKLDRLLEKVDGQPGK